MLLGATTSVRLEGALAHDVSSRDCLTVLTRKVLNSGVTHPADGHRSRARDSCRPQTIPPRYGAAVWTVKLTSYAGRPRRSRRHAERVRQVLPSRL